MERSPFKRIEKSELIKANPSECTKRNVIEQEKQGLYISLFALFSSFLIIYSHNLRYLLASWFLWGNEGLMLIVCLIVFSLCIANIAAYALSLFRLSSPIQAKAGEPILDDKESHPEKDMILSPPKTIARGRNILTHSPQSPQSPQNRPSALYASPVKTHLKTDHSPNPKPYQSPAFTKVYGGTPPLSKSKEDEKTQTKVSYLRANSDYASIISTPLPDTGSPKLNRIACDNLPEWTERLRTTISSNKASPCRSLPNDNFPEKEEAAVVSSPPTPLKRHVFEADNAISMLGLGRTIDFITENLRFWFYRKIIKPLSEDIQLVAKEFEAQGLDHLTPHCPATFSIFSRAITSTSTGSGMSNSTIFMNAPSTTTGMATAAAAIRPQTLIELSQRFPDHELVKKRLCIERYLSWASVSTQRALIIKKILTWSEDKLLSSLCWTAQSFKLNDLKDFGERIDPNDDALLLMRLFCAFMDEKLPSEDPTESQAFTSRHLVSSGSPASNRSDAIQIQELPLSNAPSPFFQLIAENNIYKVYPGGHSVFHVIIYLVEYVHRHHQGFLRLGNLASPAIDLVSILDI